MNAAPIRVMLYSHDAQGLGHLRRNLALAHHLAQQLPDIASTEVTGLVATGLTPDGSFELPQGFDWLVLPGVKKTEGMYLPRRLRASRDELALLRSSLLEASLLSFAPDLVIIDRHPYGVRQELREPLRRFKRTHPGSRVVLGLREILDSPDTLAREWASLGSGELLRELIDQVWVYGDPKVHNLVDTGEAPGVLSDRIRFTGYLAHGRSRLEDSQAQATALDEPFVLTTAGGGSDGFGLLMEAAAMESPRRPPACGGLRPPAQRLRVRQGGPQWRPAHPGAADLAGAEPAHQRRLGSDLHGRLQHRVRDPGDLHARPPGAPRGAPPGAAHPGQRPGAVRGGGPAALGGCGLHGPDPVDGLGRRAPCQPQPHRPGRAEHRAGSGP